MIGFNFSSFQYYSYQDIEKLHRTNQYDAIGCISINEEQKIIKQDIDRSKHVRLSDLIFSIKAKFIRFHLGQVLELFIKILEKIIEMECHKQIDHFYLDENRIWLKLENNSPQLSIVYIKFKYSIKFTGYQCIVYEQELAEQVKASDKVLKIISSILLDLKKNKITCNKNDSNFQEIVNKIYDPIIQSCQQSNIIQTQYCIKNIIIENGYDEKYQTVSYDDRIVDHYIYQARDYRLNDIKQEFFDCINKYQENKLILECLLMQKIEQIGKNVDNFIYQKTKENEEQQEIQSLQLIQQKREIQCINFINSYFCICFEKFEKQYKFQYSKEEQDKIFQSILIFIQNDDLLKYFENSIHFYKTSNQTQLEQNYLYIYKTQSQPIIFEEVEMYFELQILKLIEDLI